MVNEMTFEVGLPVAAVEDLIRSRIDAPTLASGLIAGAVHGRRYVGRVAGARFEVWIRRRSYNSVCAAAHWDDRIYPRREPRHREHRPPRKSRAGLSLRSPALGRLGLSRCSWGSVTVWLSPCCW